MCVIGDQPELTIENLEIGDSQEYSWRNVFSCINLLRILNKLTKWKHSRIMVSDILLGLSIQLSTDVNFMYICRC